MHQVIDFDPQATYIDIPVDGIYALGHRLDREEFERAARIALQDDEDAGGSPLTHWPGQDAAIAELGGDGKRRRWLRGLSLETLAGELVAARLLDTEAVKETIEAEYHPDDDVDLEFALQRVKFRLNQRAAA